MKKYLKARGNYANITEQFFIFSDQTPVLPIRANNILKAYVKNIGLDNTLYLMHILRSGRSSNLLKYGYSIDQIKSMGRWRSSAVYKYIKKISFVEKLTMYDSLWIFGDNYVASTSRVNFKLSQEEFFAKKNFDFDVFCGSRYENNEPNLIKRVIYSLAVAFNRHIKLPRFIIVMLDNDIISWMGYSGFRVSRILGSLLECLVNIIEKMIADRKAELPTKAVKFNYPIVYWAVSPRHIYFLDNELRKKFNLCLEAVIKQKAHMHVLKIKEIWDEHDDLLVNKSSGTFTSMGKKHHWRAIDAAFKFNVLRFSNQGRPKKQSVALNGKKRSITSHSHATKNIAHSDIEDFFKRRREDTSPP